MTISERMKSARRLLEEVRAQQRALLVTAAADEDGRTLGYLESDEYDLLGVEAKALERELVMLGERLELEATTARPPRSSADE